ncbi:Clavaminate synthase-like protein [Mollisia scopiformis]|uniref:Clavaminate synthase-like protein n=1 Tax=Mollisia scopiformis TaxID=149040 RepID=A0A194XJS9_MOLSC|nr:Clavaminate synthase-like protein [Mollisia scopiformis]KUJ20037.1 Clavaminate synthase-like protein [Mollisia scopiformis]
MVITPIKHGADKKCKLGATVTGLDLNNVSDEDLATLKEATHRYQLLMIKDHHNLDVKKHWELVTRLDPTAHEVHGHGTVAQFAKTGGMLAKRTVHGIPEAPNVRLIGKGYQGDDHYGIKNFTAAGASNDYHRYPPSKEAFEAGNTQFQRWHIDAPLYDREPPHFTALRAIKCPDQADIQVNWDDGSGLSMKTKPGQTAFVSGIQLYELLTDEEKMLAENSWVEYAPFPYMWIENCKGRPNGLGLETEGLEHKMDEMPEWEESKIKRYPMVWVNPLGQKALQVHGICVRKMFLKATPTSEVKVVDDLVEIRKLLHSWQERIIRPEYVLSAPVEEGDVQMWDNWSVFHTAIDYPDQYGPRTMHQANLAASDSPVGPVPIPVS